MAILEIKNGTMRFGGLVAVDGLDLEINEGEIVSLIGPNGAGKTTVFNMITGVYEISGGEIFFDGKCISNMNPIQIVKSGIARTFQNIRLFQKMRTIENALVGAHIHRNYNLIDALLRTRKYKIQEEELQQKAIDTLTEIGLGGHLHDYASELPYGLQRRLEIARAMMTGAKLLLLDEPAAGMNPQESEDLMLFIRGLVKKGYTILLIEHDMNVVMNVSDRIYVLDYGKRIAYGQPEEISGNAAVIKAYLGDASSIMEDEAV